MKNVGGILGILGGLLGILEFLTYAVVGPSFDLHASTAVLNALGGVAALTCLVASAAIVLGPGRTAGICLLVAGLIAMFVYLSIGAQIAGLLLVPAVAGGVLAAVHGQRAPRRGVPPRREW
jgi:hypothetical protein